MASALADWPTLDLRYPTDEAGFAVAFPDADSWKAVMDKYNVLVVPILDEKETDVLAEDMWRLVGPAVTSDPYTWEDANWPNPEHPLLTLGYVETETAFRVRTHSKLVHVFAELHRTRDLVTTIDVYGIKRATILPNGIVRNDWRPKPLRLHWDTDVLDYAADLRASLANRRFQALIAVNQADDANPQEIGGFSCVVGSANHLESWIRDCVPSPKKVLKMDAPKRKALLKYVPDGNPWQQNVQRLPIRRGCAVLWDAGVAHNNFGNHSLNPRLTMYCRMVPRTVLAAKREKQTITNYWNANPQRKQRVEELCKWTLEEQHYLGLRVHKEFT